jgi:predicted dehydrogenase
MLASICGESWSIADGVRLGAGCWQVSATMPIISDWWFRFSTLSQTQIGAQGMLPFQKKLSRRGFISHSIAGLTAAGLPSWYASKQTEAAILAQLGATKVRSANDQLQLGWVGIGSPSSRALQVYGTTKDFKQLKHVAVCDVDARHLYRAAIKFREDNKLEPQQYSNYRDLISRDDIDVVVVATPDHWHAEIAISAMLKGKDVYCEKPLTLTIEESLQLMQVQKATGRILQTGSQQRSEFRGLFRLATEVVRSGAIGKIKMIECRIGSNPTSGPIEEAAVPRGLDWEQWLGSTPVVPYRIKKTAIGRDLENRVPTNCHYNFRWFQAYSGGKMTDWGAHHIDIAQWCLNMDGSGPTKIVCESMSDVYSNGDGYDWPKDFRIKLTYSNGVDVLVMSGGGSQVAGLVSANGESRSVTPNENGVLIQGELGTVFVGRNLLLASNKELLNTEPKLDKPIYDKMATHHFGNFLDCVVNRKEPICSATVGGGSVIICHLGVIALQIGMGKELTWDPAKHLFTGANAEQANSKIARARRSGPIKLA